MDFIMKKKPCKHIYFIVTQVAQNDEILDYFRNSTTISKSAYKVLDDQLEKRLRSRLENMNSKKNSKDIDLKEDKDCVICFTEMDKDQEALEDCGICKKYFHTECIARWKQHNATCPLCRGNLVGSGNNPLDKLQKITV
jgi:hypothetical protein